MTKKHGRSFAGRVALVTGGSRGIGKGIVRRLASDGAAVAFRYSSSEEKAKRLASEIEAAGGKVLPIKADSASAEDDRERGQYSHPQSERWPYGLRGAGCLTMAIPY
jgi:NAD(P)-dependent dehydrogenase (short-subunit alcohol dehydrogenase family)